MHWSVSRRLVLVLRDQTEFVKTLKTSASWDILRQDLRNSDCWRVFIIWFFGFSWEVVPGFIPWSKMPEFRCRKKHTHVSCYHVFTNYVIRINIRTSYKLWDRFLVSFKERVIYGNLGFSARIHIKWTWKCQEQSGMVWQYRMWAILINHPLVAASWLEKRAILAFPYHRLPLRKTRRTRWQIHVSNLNFSNLDRECLS